MTNMDTLGYCEVLPDQHFSSKWKFINVNIGAAQSTLQDIKYPESSGGYEYKDSCNASSPCRNRFIYWRIKQDTIELSESSLDFNLSGNNVKFQFEGTPILEGGVSVHETRDNVVLLITTVASVHRLLFPHPRMFNFSEYAPDVTLTSIFNESSLSITRDPNHFYVLNHGHSGNAIPETAASHLSMEGIAYFALGHSHSSNVSLIIMGGRNNLGEVVTYDLKQSSVMKRFLTGFVPSVIRGDKDCEEAPLSMFINQFEGETVVFALCRDAKLRMWSCATQECLLCADVIPDRCSSEGQNFQSGVQKHLMRKTVTIDPNGSIVTVIAAFLCFPNQKIFSVFKPVKDLSSYSVEMIAVVHVPDWDLIDFSLTGSHLWVMWSSSDYQPVIKYLTYQLKKDRNSVGAWKEVSLEPVLVRQPYLADGLEDPRQAYLKQIFSPGRFSSATINKAINIYKKSLNTSIMASIVPENVLVQEVINVVENEIQMQTSDYEVVDDVYLEIQLEAWSKFYSCCVEYHEVGMKATGLTAFEESGITYVIKKGSMSILRPIDVIEHLFQSDDREVSSDIISTLPVLSHDDSVCKALVNIMRCVKIINVSLNEEVKEAFQHDIYHLQNPQKVAQTILNNILCPAKVGDKTVIIDELREEYCSGMIGGIVALLQLLNLDENQTSVMDTDDKGLKFINDHWLNSNMGISCICNSIIQTAKLRFDICRDLLILQLILQDYNDLFKMSSVDINKLESETVPKTSLFIHAYYIIIWSCETSITSDYSMNNMSELQQLSVLNLSDANYEKTKFNQKMSVLELFVVGEGGKIAKKCIGMLESKIKQKSVSSSFLALIKNICSHVWPISVKFVFPEFLMTNFQFAQLQEYVRLLQSWCEVNGGSRKFLLGFSYLNQGEHVKAVDCFLNASEDIPSNSFLRDKLLKAESNKSKNLSTFYYLKVIQLLEQFSVAEHILKVATTAVGETAADDPNMTILQSIIFKYHLELGHYDEAYAAMNSIEDSSSKKDCLRQFVVVLCERQQLKTLVGFPYNDQYEDIVSIMEAKARSVDLTQHNYYEIIYSFHIMRENYRKAGSIMYEYGMRLGTEVSGLKGLQKQVKCYLSTINCLNLVNPKYAWIIKPYNSQSKNMDHNKRKIEVLELYDIKKEYKHVTAVLHLIQKTQDASITTGPLLSASETVALLVNEGLFDMAITLCSEYKLSYEPIFEGLTSRSIKMTQRTEPASIDEATSDWDWLSANIIGEGHQSFNALSAVEQAWNLLKTYLESFEKPYSSIYHRCIANKLLLSGFGLPIWLISSYLKRNPAELLRLYIYYDQLYEAGNLAMEYIDAVLGKGSDHFNLKNSLNATNPPVWLPYTAIDQLISTLNQAQADVVLSTLHQELNEKLCSYDEAVSRISDDMIRHGVATA